MLGGVELGMRVIMPGRVVGVRVSGRPGYARVVRVRMRVPVLVRVAVPVRVGMGMHGAAMPVLVVMDVLVFMRMGMPVLVGVLGIATRGRLVGVLVPQSLAIWHARLPLEV